MLNNVNAKKKLTQVIIAVLVVCLTLTGGAYLLSDYVSKASAATKTVSMGSAGDWNTAMNNSSSGDIINVTVTADISASAKLTAVKSGVTVNLNMNGKTIYWDTEATGTNITSKSYPLGTNYWGLITNNGTLSITGTGTIRVKQVNYNGKVEEYAADGIKVAAIANMSANSDLTLGSGITINTYAAQTYTSSKENWLGTMIGYSHLYVYGVGVYNEGKVTTSGTINANAFAAAAACDNSNQSYHYAFSYGIYGGTVRVNGGSVSSNAYSGAATSSSTCKEENQMANYGIGIYSNNAVILGNSSITTTATSWMTTTSHRCWNSGSNVSFSAGVLYTGENYPVIGASTDISASFKYCSDGEQVTIPGTSLVYTVVKAEDPGEYARRAYSVVGVPRVLNAIGNQTQQRTWYDDNGFFGNGTSATGESTNAVNICNNFNATMKYLTEETYNNGQKGGSYLVDALSTYQKESGAGSAETKTSIITDGAPLSDGTQYLIMYRFYRNTISAANIEHISNSFDSYVSSRVKTRAAVTVGGSSCVNGVMVDASSNVKLSSGGVSQNAYYYTYESATTEKVSSATYATRNIANMAQWTGGNTVLPPSGTTCSKGQTLIIYLNYTLNDPSAVRVVAADKGTAISQYTETTSFTADYTGAALVPGTDFNIGIADMGADSNVASDDLNDNTVVTNVYNITGNGSGSGNNATAVTYRYSTDGTSYTNGLPKNAGTYTIEVTVNADTTYSTTSYNRTGGTFYITCTINKAEAKITGPATKTGTYGSTYAELVPFSDYSVSGKGSDSLSGTWSFTGVTSTAYPDASSSGYSVTLTWTPSGASANNYLASSYSVTLIVNKRDVSVKVADSTATYGDNKATYAFNYTNAAACDETLKAGWLAGSTIEIYSNGAWVEYSAGTPAGSYDVRIATFGGAADTNNNFTLNSGNGKLTVNKKSIVYTAAATDRAYNGSADVDVTLTYASGVYGSDTFSTSISTTGTMANANAGQDKAVTVDVASVPILNAGNYTLVIANASTLSVNIAKADPTGIACAAATPTLVYDSTRTLNDIALTTTESSVAGTWSWVNGDIVPTCDVPNYTAKFTPTDANNYNTATQSVTITVSKKEVIVSVPQQNIAYGDSVPAITGSISYTGFTGTDTFDSVFTNGSNDVSTTYTRGASVGEYPITVATTLSAVNYSFTAQNSKVVVSKKALTITVADDSIAYGAVAPEYDVTDITATGFYGSDTLASLGGTPIVATTYIVGNAVGTYPINAAGYTSVNYEITYVPGTLTVSKAVLSVTPTAQTVTYGAAVPTYAASNLYTLTGFVSGDTASTITVTGAPVFTTTYQAGKNVGSYPVTVTVSGMSTANYTFKGVEGALTVNKAIPNVVTAPTATVINSQTFGEAVFSNDAVVTNPNNSTLNVAGTFAFDDATTVPVFGMDGTYNATFTPTDTTNYETVALTSLLTINPKTITGTPVITGSPMAGQTLTVSLASMNPTASQYYTYQWYRGSTPITGAQSATYSIVTADIGSQLYVAVTGVNAYGYVGNAQSAKTTTIIQALTPATVAQLSFTVPSDCTYDGNTHTASVAIAAAYAGYVGNVTVKYNGVATLPKNAGNYIVTVDIGIPDEPVGGYTTAYYGPVSGLAIGTFTISPANFNVNFTADDKTYDGTTAATATVATSGVFGSDSVSLAAGYTFAFDNANAGTAKTVTASGMALTGTSAANYKLVVGNATADINKAALSARANGVSRAYDGTTAVSVTFTNISGYADVDSASSVYPTTATATAASANVGTQILSGIAYTLGGTSAGNYVLNIVNESSATVVITAATPTVTAPTINGLVYNSAKTLQSIDLSPYTDANGYWTFNDTTIVPTVSTKTYEATYVSTNRNYSNFVTNITVNVTPAAVVLTADNKTVTYGQTPPTYTVTATGLTGDDKIGDMGGNYNFTCTYSAGSDIGTYTIIVNSALDSENYTFTTAPGTLTVAPATLIVTAASVDKTYDGNANVTVNFTVVSGKYGSDDVSLSAMSITGTSATANAGTTTVTYAAPSLQGTKASNYELSISPASGVLTVTINKANVSGVAFPTDGTVEFGYNLTYVTFQTAGTGDGTFAYENASSTVPNAVGIYSTYTVIFTPTDARNYNTQSQIVTLEVIKCSLNYVVGVSGTPQSGQLLTAVITGMPSLANGYIHYQWYRIPADPSGQTVAISGATSATYECTDDDIGYTLSVMTTFDASAPYVFSDTADITTYDGTTYGIVGDTVNAIKEITLSFWQKLMRWFYKLIAAITGLKLSIGK